MFLNVVTNNTAYTPESPLVNDQTYYWRVRAISGVSVSDWSSEREFKMKWYIQPQLLTPTDGYQHVRFPFFSWTPVPGATYYRIEVSTDRSFPDPDPDPTNHIDEITSNTFFSPKKYTGDEGWRYWRVTPYIKGNAYPGASSSASFYTSYAFSSPSLIYPFYYYTPNPKLKPAENRTAPLPVFIWHRLTNPAPMGGTMARAYRIQVSTDPIFLGGIVWEIDTENTSAVPTTSAPFTPAANTDYFWRVAAIDGIGGPLVTQWSQVWLARFDLGAGASPTPAGDPPTLLRPANAAEIVETTPLFEWLPVDDATSYTIQISADPAFSSIVEEENTPYPAFTPQESIAQRFLGKLDFGTYYWRVRANFTGGAGSWSTPNRFQIASQSEWAQVRGIGNPANQLQIGSDPADDVIGDANLTTLFGAQEKDAWYFGFNYSGAGADAYLLYLDIDHADGSGADRSPLTNITLTTISAHQPEYAVVFYKNASGGYTADDSAVYRWDQASNQWYYPQLLPAIGGQVLQDETAQYIEVKLPNTPIGSHVNTGSYSLSLLSLDLTAHAVKDSVPSDPSVPGSGPLSRFTSISDRANLIFPPNQSTAAISTYASIPPFFWDYPTGKNDGILQTNPSSGVLLEVHKDPKFTSLVGDFEIQSSDAYYASTDIQWYHDLTGDDTYYWRLQVDYCPGSTRCYGAWTQGSHLNDPPGTSQMFVREGFVPEDLSESVDFATPTLSWSRVEGASTYDVEVDNDSDFSSPIIKANTYQTTYTYNGTLPNGTYFWRVRARRYSQSGTIYNDWVSPEQPFILTLPTPSGLTPHDPSYSQPIHTMPTLCWDPLIQSSNGQPVLAAYKYFVQLSRNPNPANETLDSITTEQTCWTPTKGLPDGKYYWHVAMVDGNNRRGGFSQVATFAKQYPLINLVSPTPGDQMWGNPTFVWKPAAGAARYRLQVSTYPNFSTIYKEVTTHNTRYTPDTLYPQNQVYYWRVAMIDKNGNYGPYNDAQVFLGSGNKVFVPLVTN